MSTKSGGSAFPQSDSGQHSTGFDLPPQRHHPGMTLRDYFAGQALTGILDITPLRDMSDFDMVARRSYNMADAMIAERDRT